jgi:hypothetical protein
MTEAEWLSSADPTAMLVFLQGEVSDRKLRLFAVACCRRGPPSMMGRGESRLVELAERCADEAVDGGMIMAAWNDALDSLHASAEPRDSDAYRGRLIALECLRCACGGSHRAAINVAQWAAPSYRHGPATPEQVGQVSLLRDLVGNPFRPSAVAAAWLTADVTAIASAIYDDRAFDLLPVLADALEDAGCDDEAILDHCRSAAEHVRGCWLIDLLLSKE